MVFMKLKSVPVEELGLDLRSISEKELEELLNFIESCLREELDRILGQRLLGYASTISVEVVNDTLNIAIDLETDSYLTSHISLENVLDQVLRHVFTRTRMYLSRRFRKINEAFNKQ